MRRDRVLLGLLLVVVASCSPDKGTGPAPNLGTAVGVTILPGSLLLPSVGATQTLRAAVIQDDGDTVEVTGSVTWQSSNTSVVSISAAGVATAGAMGSAVITAQAEGFTSAPAMALVAQPAAGALLVSDAQVAGAITPVDPAAPYVPGWQYRVRLRGAVPDVGQVVLASGAASVGGRVVSVGPSTGGTREVVLELLPLDGMFQDLTVDLQLPLDEGTLVAARTSAGANLRSAAQFAVRDFECESELPPGLQFPVTLDAFDVDIDPSLTLDLQIEQSSIRRLVAHGSIAARISANPLITAALEAKAECLLTVRVIILPIGGPIALLIGGQIPVGVGFEVGAKATFGQLGIDAFYEASMSGEFGIDCTGPCEVVAEMTASPPAGFFRPVLPSLSDDLRFELTGSAFGFAKLTLGNPFVRELQFETVELKAGVEQKFELAGPGAQATDAAYASGFALKPVIEFKTTAKLQALAGLLGITLADLSFNPELPAIAQSPRGSFTITPAHVVPGDDVALGDAAVFTVTLDPVTYLGAYAVDGVEIRWLRSDGTTSTLEPGRPGCTDLAAAQGQVSFSCETDFLRDHVGPQTFFAFVRARLFGVPIPVPLEVAVDGRATVEVSGFAVSTTSLAAASRGIDYGAQLEAQDGAAPFTWSLASGTLPPGLSLGADGAISGTPTARGTFPFTVRATGNDGLAATRPLSIAVHDVEGTWTGTFNGTFTSFDGSVVRDSPGTITLVLTQDGTAVSGTATLVTVFGPGTGTASGTFTGTGLSTFSMNATSQTTPPCAAVLAGSAAVDAAAGTMVVTYSGTDCNGTITGAVAQLTRSGN